MRGFTLSVCVFRHPERTSWPPAALRELQHHGQYKCLGGQTHCMLSRSVQLWRFLAFQPSILQNCQATGSNAQEVFWRTPFAPESSWMGGWTVLGHLDSLQGGWVNEISWAFQYKAASGPGVRLVWASAVNSSLPVLPVAAAPKPASWSKSPEGGAG